MGYERHVSDVIEVMDDGDGHDPEYVMGMIQDLKDSADPYRQKAGEWLDENLILAIIIAKSEKMSGWWDRKYGSDITDPWW